MYKETKLWYFTSCSLQPCTIEIMSRTCTDIDTGPVNSTSTYYSTKSMHFSSLWSKDELDNPPFANRTFCIMCDL